MRGRGRPEKGYPKHPNRILSRAIKTGLSTTVYLQRAIASKTTCSLYESSKEKWTQAKIQYQYTVKQGVPDFTAITESENNIRKHMYRIIAERAASFGFYEPNRVKNRHESIGLLNQRLNIIGAVLRFVGMSQYSFSDMELLVHNGESVLGFPANSYGPQVIPIHNLSELDFIDSGRSPLQILAMHSTIFGVSHVDTKRYANLYMLKMSPFLDYVYTEYTVGLPGLDKKLISTLRELKDDITKNFKTSLHQDNTVTANQSFVTPYFDVSFFETQLMEAQNSGVHEVALLELQRILNGGSIVSTIDYVAKDGSIKERPAPCLTKDDVEYLWSMMVQSSGRMGSHIHQKISRYLPTYYSIKHAIIDDALSDSSDMFKLCAEIPLNTNLGKGRADLILFERSITPDGQQVLWRPVLLLEIKTRSGYYWDFGFEEKKSKSRMYNQMQQLSVPDFRIKSRGLDDDELDAIIHSTHSEQTQIQLNAYSDAIVEAYQDLAEISDPILIQKGTLFIDTATDIRQVRLILTDGVYEVFKQLRETNFNKSQIFEIETELEKLHFSLVVHSTSDRGVENHTPVSKPDLPSFNPFEHTIDSTRRFILHLSASTMDSGGASAAWISRYNHTLDMIQELQIKEDNILWIDLAGEFQHPLLSEAKLRVNQGESLSTKELDVREFFSKVQSENLLDICLSYIFDNRELPSLHVLTRNKFQLIIVSGWDRIQDSTPSLYRYQLERLAQDIIEQLPDEEHTTILWLTNPVPNVGVSQNYGMRTLLPYYSDSIFARVANELIWNLPVPPSNVVFFDSWSLPIEPLVPAFDDVRVIIGLTATDMKSNLIHVPALVGWSKKFSDYAMQSPSRQRTLDYLLDSSNRQRLKTLALDLLPWIVGLQQNTLFTLPSLEQNSSQITIKRKPARQTSPEPTILERTKYRPKLGKDGLAYVPITSGKINSRRVYRGHNKIKTKVLPISTGINIEKIQYYDVVEGHLFINNDGDTIDEILIVEDIRHSKRTLVGHFTEGTRRGQTGVLWSTIDNERLCSLLDSLEKMELKYLLFRKRDEKIESWEYDEIEKMWKPQGIVEIVAERGGSFGKIRSYRGQPDSTLTDEPEDTPNPPDYSKIRKIIRSLVTLERERTNVTISLHSSNEECQIRMTDLEDVEIHSLLVTGTPDLVRILRWTLGGRVFITGMGIRLAWNPFEDIDYGDFDAVRSLVETNAPRTAGANVPHTVDEIITKSESEEMILILAHDTDACQVVSKQSHMKCWRLREKDGFDIPARLAKLMTGKEVYGLLSSGEFKDKDQTYSVEVRIDDSLERPAIYVYHEDSWVRRLLREYNIFLSAMESGTFLRTDELWEMFISVQENIVYWNAFSTVTGKKLSNYDNSYSLNPTQDLEKASEELIEVITKIVSPHQIKEFSGFKMKVEKLLVSHGFGDGSPLCKLQVSHEGGQFTINLLYVGEEKERAILTNVFTVSPEDSHEAVLEGLTEEIGNGELSRYNIENTEEFLERVSYLLGLLEDDDITPDYQDEEEATLDAEDAYERVLLDVIAGYRVELKQGKDVAVYLAQALKQIATLRIEQEQLDAALGMINECVELLGIKSTNSLLAHNLLLEIQDLKAQINSSNN